MNILGSKILLAGLLVLGLSAMLQHRQPTPNNAKIEILPTNPLSI